MKNMEKYIFTVFFVAGLGIYSIASMVNAKNELSKFPSKLKGQNGDEIKETILDLDATMGENVAASHGVIETYGLITKLLGKNEVNGFEYVKDKNGYLSLGNFWNEVYDVDEKALALDVELFYEKLQKNNTKMLFVTFPQKVSEKWTEGYSGIPYDDFSYRTNQFMIQARRYRIPNVDLAKTFNESDKSYEDLFFKTDYLWTSNGAFLGFQTIVDKIEDMGIDIDPDGFYRNLDNYEKIHYENMMLGSAGRSVGLIYAGGAENFDLYYTDRNEKYKCVLDEKETLNGNVKETLIDFTIPDAVTENKNGIYNRSLYDMYMSGIKSEMDIENENKKDGPKVLMITDPFALPITSWMAPMCSELDFMWACKHSQESIERKIASKDYDLVIIGLYPNDMNADYIHFTKEK